MSSNVLQAQAMSQATLADPQFRLPLRPKVADGLVTIDTAQGRLVEGGPSRQLLGGGASQDLTAVWNLLDGSRNLQELTAHSGLAKKRVHAITSLLYASGLLEDAQHTIDVAGFDNNALKFFSRSIDSTRVNTSGAEAAARLRNTAVTLVADAPHQELRDAVQDTLWASGFGKVEQLDGQVSARTGLVVAVGLGPLVEAAVAQAANLGIPVFPVQLLGTNLYYGPQIHPDYSLSFQDLAQQIGAEAWAAPAASVQEQAAQIIAAEVTTISSRVGHSQAQQALVRLNLNDMKQDRLVAVSVTSDGMPLAYAFEASTEFAPRHMGSPKDHQVHYKSSNLALTMQSKQWPSAPTRDFSGRPDRPGHLDCAALSWLVRVAAGNREIAPDSSGRVQRWAPTGGNLGSVQAYVLVRDVPGLPLGGYGFQRGDNTLAHLPWIDPTENLGGVDPAAPATIIFTAALGRVASKYSSFGWRIIHLDAGVATAHVAAVATSLQLQANTSAMWDDDGIGQLLGIDLDTEPITAVINLYPNSQEGSNL